MKFHKTALDGVWLIELEAIHDQRGFFARSYSAAEFAAQGLHGDFPQQNTSMCVKAGTLRGLHYRPAPHDEVKVLRCVSGAVFNLIADVRPASPTFRQWQGFELSAQNRLQVYAPGGLAHGYQALSDGAEAAFLVSRCYQPGPELGVRHDDPAFAIELPLPVSLVSAKDAAWPDFDSASSHRP